jgi:hypothetical protein
VAPGGLVEMGNRLVKAHQRDVPSQAAPQQQF